MPRFALAVLTLLVGLLPANAQEPELKQVKTVPKFEIPAIEQGPDGKMRAVPNQTRTVYLGAKVGFKKKATIQMRNYLPVSAAALPAKIDRTTKAMGTIKLVYNNDREGCCVVSSGFHGLGIVSVYDSDSPGEIKGTDKEASSEYHRIGGPGDNGLVVDEALEDWRLNGLLVGGKRRKCEAWGQFDVFDPSQLKTVLIVFGGRLAFNVPQEWMNNATPNAVWDKPARYNFIGGHDVRMIGYDERGVQIATWGMVVTMTWRALLDRNIFDEGAFEMLPDWTNADGISGAGISVARMREDVAKIKNGETPSWEPDVTPPTPPVPPTPPTPPGPGPDVVTLTVNGAAVVLDFKNKKITPPFGWTVDGAAPKEQTLPEVLKKSGLSSLQIDLILQIIAAFVSKNPPPQSSHVPNRVPWNMDIDFPPECKATASGLLECPNWDWLDTSGQNARQRAAASGLAGPLGFGVAERVTALPSRVMDRFFPARPVRQWLRGR